MTSSNTEDLFDCADKNTFQARYWIPTIWVENLSRDLKIDSAQALVDYCVATIKPEACCTRFERCPTSQRLHAHLYIQMPLTVRLWKKLINAFGTAGVHILYAKRDGKNAMSYAVKEETSEGNPAFFNINPEDIKPWGVLGGKTAKVQKAVGRKEDKRTLEEKSTAWAEQKLSREAAEMRLIREAIKTNPIKWDVSFAETKKSSIDAEDAKNLIKQLGEYKSNQRKRIIEKTQRLQEEADDLVAKLASEFDISLEEAQNFSPVAEKYKQVEEGKKLIAGLPLPEA